MSYYETIVTIDRSVVPEPETTAQDCVVKVTDEQRRCCSLKNKKFLGYLGFAFSVSVISCAGSLVMIRYFSSYIVHVPAECERCKVGETASLDVDNFNRDVHNDNQSTMVPEKQIQAKIQNSTRRKTGALVRADKDLLYGQPSELKWTNTARNSYLDGIYLVPYVYKVTKHELECLKITMDDNYLVTIQITYFIKKRSKLKSDSTYFSLVRFRSNEPLVVAVRYTDLQSSTRKISEAIVTLQHLQKDDVLCVMAEDPELIYASNIDNFFGVSSL